MEMITGGAAVGDYDNDGWEDIYFTVHDGRGVLYRNMGKIISPKVITRKILENTLHKKFELIFSLRPGSGREGFIAA